MVVYLFNREWNGDLKKLPNIKMRKVSAKKNTAVKETHTEEEEHEEDEAEEEDVSQDSDVELLEDEA